MFPERAPVWFHTGGSRKGFILVGRETIPQELFRNKQKGPVQWTGPFCSRLCQHATWVTDIFVVTILLPKSIFDFNAMKLQEGFVLFSLKSFYFG